MIYGTAARQLQQEQRDLRPYEYWTYDRYFDDFFNTYSLPVGYGDYWNYAVFPQRAPEIFPTVYVVPKPTEPAVLPGEDPGNETVVSPEAPETAKESSIEVPGDSGSVEPEFQKGSIFAPGEIWGDRPETDWGKVYDDYVVLNQPVQEVPVAVDWGEFVSGAIDIFQGQSVAQPVGFGGGPTGLPTGMGTPAKVTIDTRTGRVTPCRRRRRRRLLTASDLNDLAALKTIIGGGSAMNAAVVKAIR